MKTFVHPETRTLIVIAALLIQAKEGNNSNIHQLRNRQTQWNTSDQQNFIWPQKGMKYS